MLSNRPYLIRAFYEWINDSGCTPILVVDANHPRAKIPLEFVEGGEIVFNVSPTAVRDLKMMNEVVEFKASFSGVIHIISAPISGILAIYAEENGEGIFFDSEEEQQGDTSAENVFQLQSIEGTGGMIDQEITSSEPVAAKPRPVLRIVE